MSRIIICEKLNPWVPRKLEPNEMVRHMDVEEVGEQRDGWPGGDIQGYRCLNCGTRWTEELPQ